MTETAGAPPYERCGAKNRQGTPCGLPAGWGTDHPSQGRCKLHGGRSPVTHGRYSMITRPSVQQRLDELARLDHDVMDLAPELHLLRALLVDYLERYEAMSEALLAWHASFQREDATPKLRQILDVADASRLIVDISRIVERIHKIKAQSPLSLETFRKLMEAMALTVARHVQGPQTLRAIEQDWLTLAV